ncbi:hypothetical protein LSH36_853g01019, partial [Paralvinella palmiformis]
AALTPSYIFPRDTIGTTCYLVPHFGSLGLATPSALVNSDELYVVLNDFIKPVNVSKYNTPILVIDNHENHVTLGTINATRENGVIIFSFLIHCTHLTQPLDVSIYSTFIRYYNATCTDLFTQSPRTGTYHLRHYRP